MRDSLRRLAWCQRIQSSSELPSLLFVRLGAAGGCGRDRRLGSSAPSSRPVRKVGGQSCHNRRALTREKPSVAQLDTHLQIVCTRRMGRSVLRHGVSRGGSLPLLAAMAIGWLPQTPDRRASAPPDFRYVSRYGRSTDPCRAPGNPRRDRLPHEARASVIARLTSFSMIEFRLLVLGGRRSGISEATEPSCLGGRSKRQRLPQSPAWPRSLPARSEGSVLHALSLNRPARTGRMRG
jgi:hypothetical protein